MPLRALRYGRRVEHQPPIPPPPHLQERADAVLPLVPLGTGGLGGASPPAQPALLAAGLAGHGAPGRRRRHRLPAVAAPTVGARSVPSGVAAGQSTTHRARRNRPRVPQGAQERCVGQRRKRCRLECLQRRTGVLDGVAPQWRAGPERWTPAGCGQGFRPATLWRSATSANASFNLCACSACPSTRDRHGGAPARSASAAGRRAGPCSRRQRRRC